MRTPGAVLSASCLLFVAGANAAFDYHSIRGRKAAVTDDIIEGEALPMKRGSRVQGMRNFGPQWSGDAHLLWDGKIGESMESRFHVPHDGRYALSLVMTLAPDYGMFSVSLNGKVVKEGVDLYSAKVKLSPVVDLGEVRLKAGEQTLLCTLTGSNEKAKHFRGDRFLLGLDYIKAVPLDPSPTQQEKSPKLPERTAFPTIDHTFEEVRTVLEKYCYDCHGDGGKPKGNVDLTKLTSRDELLENAKLANKLADVLQYREMPPKGKDRPTEGESRMLVSFSNRVVYEALEKDHTLPPIVIRRMNRYEYNNAVRDLLQLKGDIYPLPEKVIRPYKPYFDPASGRLPNSIHVGNRALGKNQIEQHLLTGVSPFAIDLQAEHGFNNRGDELSISPILMESFLKLARSVVESREFDGYSALTGSFFKPPAGSQEDEWSAIARERLAPILERAFRQPVEATTASLYLGLFDREVKAGMDFQQAMKSTIAAILSSPRFLYLLERKEGESKPLTPYELASRLSFFLWSSIPDEELLALARSGELAKPEVYGAQLERMLLHKASKALSENFARQWLRLDRLITAVPDFERFEPYYSRIGCEQWKLGLQTMIEPHGCRQNTRADSADPNRGWGQFGRHRFS